MKLMAYSYRFAIYVAAGVSVWTSCLFAQGKSARASSVQLIDLPSALQLAGARSLDIQIAREKLTEARANHEGSVWQFFPAITPGVAYHRHDNLIQDVQGNVIEVHKEAYAVGPGIGAQLVLGDAIYRNLASHQLVKAAEFGLESQRQETILAAALEYFELTKAQSAVRVAQEAVRIAQEYAEQVQRAVDAGVAFKGDALRAQLQSQKNQLTVRQTQEQQRVAGARLAETLHLERGIELVPQSGELVPLGLVATNVALDSLVAQALSTRPELAQSRFLAGAALDARNGMKYGPLIPNLGAQVFVGGLGGGNETTHQSIGESEEYLFGLGWRIGPGGLFDRSRIRAANAQLKTANLSSQKLLDQVTRQVIESLTRFQSLSDQLSTIQRAARLAEEALRLTQQRKEFGVGAVLETIQSEQELTAARLDYVNIIADFNKAQYTLIKSTGGLGEPEAPSRSVPESTSRK